MSVIVDTSVWSHALRRGSKSTDPQAAKLAGILTQGQTVLLLGVVLQEVLQGIKSARDFDRLSSHLDAFALLPLEREDYVAAARLRNLCRAKGVQASTVDFQIAAACIGHDCALLTCDKDFELISRFCPLRLL